MVHYIHRADLLVSLLNLQGQYQPALNKRNLCDNGNDCNYPNLQIQKWKEFYRWLINKENRYLIPKEIAFSLLIVNKPPKERILPSVLFSIVFIYSKSICQDILISV